jgi:hypothetical protein
MKINTERLKITPLLEKDAAFIVELLNTEGWIKNIGDRNIRSEKDAKEYIQKVTNNLHITYWTVKLKHERLPIGLVTINNIDELLSRLLKLGAEVVGEVVNYENIYRLCYIRGTEGLLIGLAEQLGNQTTKDILKNLNTHEKSNCNNQHNT